MGGQDPSLLRKADAEAVPQTHQGTCQRLSFSGYSRAWFVSIDLVPAACRPHSYSDSQTGGRSHPGTREMDMIRTRQMNKTQTGLWKVMASCGHRLLHMGKQQG